MVAADIISAFQEGSKLVSRREDDMFDRLSNRWSVGKCKVLRRCFSSSSSSDYLRPVPLGLVTCNGV